MLVNPYDDLRARFPRWSIWQSNRGRWWATLNAQLTDAEIWVGCARTVDGGDLDGLREAIEDQEERRKRATVGVSARAAALAKPRGVP